MYKIKVPAEIIPMRIDQFIAKSLPLVPNYIIQAAFQRHDVKMDGCHVSPDTQIHHDALICVYITDRKRYTVDVVYQDTNIIIINKPAGVSVVSNTNTEVTILDWVKDYLQDNNVYPCHRLDNQTSGILLFAKSLQAANIIKQAFHLRKIKKTYVCLVKGTPSPDHAILKAHLRKDSKRAIVTVMSQPKSDTVPIITGYRVLQAGQVSRIHIDLVTGRTHQIRAHMAFIGHPILGDDRYGDRAFNKAHGKSRLMLCANGLTLQAGGILTYLDDKVFTIDAPF